MRRRDTVMMTISFMNLVRVGLGNVTINREDDGHLLTGGEAVLNGGKCC